MLSRRIQTIGYSSTILSLFDAQHSLCTHRRSSFAARIGMQLSYKASTPCNNFHFRPDNAAVLLNSDSVLHRFGRSRSDSRPDKNSSSYSMLVHGIPQAPEVQTPDQNVHVPDDLELQSARKPQKAPCRCRAVVWPTNLPGARERVLRGAVAKAL